MQNIKEYEKIKQSLMLERAGIFIPLQSVLPRCELDRAEVVEYLLAHEGEIDVKVGMSIKPKRLSRAATLFVDGDELSAKAIDEICTELNLIKDECNVTIARQPYSVPLSEGDLVAPSGVPSYLLIEKKARELLIRSPSILRDIIYICSAKQMDTYRQVAVLNSFQDADTYLCCPSKMEVAQKRKVIPF